MDAVSPARLVRRQRIRNWFEHCQAAYPEYPTEFFNPKLMAHFKRYFGATNYNLYGIKNGRALFASPQITNEHVLRLVADLGQCLSKTTGEVEQKTAAGMEVLSANAVDRQAKFTQEPWQVDAQVVSYCCLRYLELLVKADRLLTLLGTLKITGLIEFDMWSAQSHRVDKLIKAFPRAAYQSALALRVVSDAKGQPADGGAVPAALQPVTATEAGQESSEVLDQGDSTMLAPVSDLGSSMIMVGEAGAAMAKNSKKARVRSSLHREEGVVL